MVAQNPPSYPISLLDEKLPINSCKQTQDEVSKGSLNLNLFLSVTRSTTQTSYLTLY